MLLHPRQPDTLQPATSSTRPLSRSSSSTQSTGLSRPQLPRSASSARPLQSIQPPQPMRDPIAPSHQMQDKLNRPSTLNSQPPTAAQGAVEPVKEDKKKDRSKLTEQWGPPPDQIRRDNEWLQRGQLLGEVSPLTLALSLSRYVCYILTV